jgi:nitrogen fixation protein NifU and related proteins
LENNMDGLYHDQLLEAAEDTTHKGQLEKADVIARHRNASCGDQVKIWVRLSDDKHAVSEIKWDGDGCVISQAAMSVLVAKINQTQPTLAEIKSWSLDEILTWLQLETISPGRLKCVLLGLETLHQHLNLA